MNLRCLFFFHAIIHDRNLNIPMSHFNVAFLIRSLENICIWCFYLGGIGELSEGT